MNKSIFKITLVGLVLLTVACLFFIYINNDHKECTSEITTIKNSQGQKVTIEKHHCKEKYNF